MGVEGLLQELLDGRAIIAQRVVARVRSEMPSFAGVPLDEHRLGIEGAVQLIVSLRLEDSEPAFGGGAQLLRELGERRARQGVPVDDLLRSWRMGIEEATAYAREVAPRTDAKPDELFDLFQQAFSLADEAMVSIAGGHRRDATGADPETERRGALVRGALLGRLGAGELHSGFSALALDPVVPYRAFRARGEEDSTVEVVNAALGRGDGSGSREGLVTIIEQELVGFTRGELPRSEFELVALGPNALPGNLPDSYRTAGRVLAAAESFGLVGVHDLASAGLLAAVIENPELGPALSAQLVEPVAELPSGPELLASVHEWLDAGMRVALAAERLFVHPNTVRYRLRRYEEETGVDLGQTEDVLRVWWALHREQAVSTEARPDS